MRSILRAQKIVLEQNATKARSADWCFAEAITAERLLCANRVLGEVKLFFISFFL